MNILPDKHLFGEISDILRASDLTRFPSTVRGEHKMSTVFFLIKYETGSRQHDHRLLHNAIFLETRYLKFIKRS